MRTSGDQASTAAVSAADISRLAGVTRATVSNWRRRHADFPPAIGGSEARPLFDLSRVQEWLAGRGIEVSEEPATELRTLVRSHAAPGEIAGFMDALSLSGGHWVVDENYSVTASFADLVVASVDRLAAADGARVAIDVLAERALEDAPATGVYVTPAPVAELMAGLVAAPAPSGVHSVLDPACGSGSLLSAAAAVGATELHGQDVLPVQVRRTELTVHAETGIAPTVRAGDSLTADAFADLRVDAVLCNPPYGQRDWGAAELAFDTRWDHGLPPRGESELAWVQHAVAHLRPGGTAVLLLPPAVATRGPGRKIRANLVRTGTLRAVVGLAPGAAQPWHVGLQIWLLRRQSAGDAVAESVLFVDAANVPTDGDDRVDWPAVTDIVSRAWRAFDSETPGAAAESGVAAVARLVDVLDDAVDLTPARYIRSSLDSGTMSNQIDEAVRVLAGAAGDLTAQAALPAAWAEAGERSWRFVTVADLVNHGQLEWFRASPPGAVRSPSRDDRRVLTAPDVATGAIASATLSAAAPAEVVEIAAGDVLVPAVRSDRTGGRNARVAGPEDAGTVRGPHVHLLRVDPDRLDPWFIAGFLTGTDNLAVTRTSTVRFDPSRLRVPVLSLAEQRRYGALFRRLFLLRASARRAVEAAESAAELVVTGLTAGALEPRGAEGGRR